MPRVLAIVLAWLLFALLFVASGRPATAQTSSAAGATGTIAGTVIDKATGDTIIDAGVEIVELKKTVRTDVDGKFTVKVPAGKYSVRFFAPLYQGARVTDVVVVENKVATADATLAPEGEEKMQVVEVVAEAAKAAEATQLVKRQKADVVSDTVSAEVIAKTPDSSAGEIVERVPAVVVSRDDRSIIRGLPDRYSFSLLNGSRLPSTDPDSRVVALDLFPADFLDSINIIKSYLPDLPGDFAGGLIDLEMKEFPETLTYSLGFSVNGNTETTFQPWTTYDGSKFDYFGFGAGYRDLPSIFGDRPIPNRKPPTDQQRALVNTLSNTWDIETKTAAPGWGADFSIGNTIGDLGLVFAATFGNNYQEHRGEELVAYQNQGSRTEPSIRPRDGSTYNHGIYETNLGAIASAGYKIGTNHKVTLRGLVNRNTEDDAFQGTGGFSESQQDQDIFQNVLQYEEEQLGFGQLAGESKWDWVELDWRTALSQSTQNIPDARFVRFVQEGDATVRSLDPKQPSLLRVYQDLDEWLTDSAIDATIPFKTALPGTDLWRDLPARLKFGAAYSYRSRDFNQRRFQYEFPNGGADLTQSPEVVLRTPFIGSDRNNGQFEFFESTLPRDTFTASQEIAAGYGMLDLPIIENRLRVVGGVRVEYSYIQLEGFDVIGEPVSSILNDLNPIPGVNLIYTPRDDMNVRYGFSNNVSRPDFRELTPAALPAPLGALEIRGNPFLVSGEVMSQELRWEWFLSNYDLVSAGFFYKDFTDPIEKIAVSETSKSIESFTNANEATNYGLEFEGRTNLGSLGRSLPEGYGKVAEQLSFMNFITNVSWINSEVDITPEFTAEECMTINPPPLECALSSTNLRRPLQGQAPFIVNAILEYDNPELVTMRLLYNTVGSYIDAAGVDGLPDIFVERRDQLDAVAIKKVDLFNVPIKVKVAVENLLNQDYLETQDGNTTERFNDGVAFSVGFSYSF